jgi:hypothetical protein
MSLISEHHLRQFMSDVISVSMLQKLIKESCCRIRMAVFSQCKRSLLGLGLSVGYASNPFFTENYFLPLDVDANYKEIIHVLSSYFMMWAYILNFAIKGVNFSQTGTHPNLMLKMTFSFFPKQSNQFTISVLSRIFTLT